MNKEIKVYISSIIGIVLIMFALLFFVISNANAKREDGANPLVRSTINSYVDNDNIHIERVKMGNCEYVITWMYEVTGSYREPATAISIVHAGDCDNPIHQQK